VNETWDFLESPSGDAAWNMALDEALLRTAAQRGRPLLRVYGWMKPAVSIGYFQKFPAELAGSYEVVRRPTGGGLVYHGEDTTFTVVTPPGHELHRLHTADAYRRIHETIARIAGAKLHGAGNVPQASYECFQRPVPGDVMMDGRKFAGGAQRRSKDGLLHQGSIAGKIDTKQLREAFGFEFCDYELPAEVQTLAGLLASEKYRTDVWNKRV
jgi:lipoate-protein ligase A